jgi:hypothetical protein
MDISSTFGSKVYILLQQSLLLSVGELALPFFAIAPYKDRALPYRLDNLREMEHPTYGITWQYISFST